MDKMRYRFKKDLEEIEGCTGSGTELITLYVPPEKQIFDVANYLRNELAQSSNIKSKTTKKNVMSAIESIMNRLKQYKRPPPNGVVFFIGHKQIGSDKTDMVSFIIEPPDPISTFLYRCDSRFYTEILRETLEAKEQYGLIVIDRKEATIGLLRGKRIQVMKNVQSLVPSKHRMGGQSARRFERLIEIAAHEFFVKIGTLANELLLDVKGLKGILVGGPGATKNFFVKKDYLHHELKKKVVDTFDVGYTDEYGLKELVENAKGALSDIELMKEKRIVQRVFDEIRKGDNMVVYGEDEVRNALNMGAVDVLMLSEELRKSRAKATCPSCKNDFERTVTDEESVICPECNTSAPILEKVDLVEALALTAEESGSKVEFISKDSEEGQMFLKAFGGIAAVLRYRMR
ncbi:MAG: peptide chain release factor aRF-1 [Thermoplasmata archaeon]|nr:peptide chain release factor aRF-1 [Thermoplasmata archaeon]